MRNWQGGIWLRLAGLVVVAGCGSGDDVTDPDQELALGSIVATIDGAPWTTTTATTIYANGRLVAAGAGGQGLTIGLGVTGVAPGTYTTGGVGSVSGSIADANNTVWEASVAGGSGTLTITQSAGNEVSGTFSFTVVRTIGSSLPQSRSVTNGRFRLRY
jgi:hypothetical protein